MYGSEDGNSKPYTNTNNKCPADKEVKTYKNTSNELIQVNGHPSNDKNSFAGLLNEVHPTQSMDCRVLKTNDQLLDEIKNLSKSKSARKAKCEICDYQKLTLQNCNLVNILDNSFLMHINCLVELNLSNNNIEKFPEIITELVNLTDLNLSHNKLQVIPDTCILLKKLRRFNLSNNQIGYESPKCLEFGLYFITHLNLGYNLISSFVLAPKCLMFLQYLNLSHNYLDYAPRWLFSEKCRSLIKLDLSYSFVIGKDFENKAQETMHLRTTMLKSVESLSLNNSNISLPVLDVVKYFENIHYLNIGNDFLKKNEGPWKSNTLWDLPINIFFNPEKITELQIHNVGIPTLPSEICLLKNLKILNASHNYLTWLPESFVQLKCLEVINLTSNKLLNLPTHFDQMISIKELRLSSNKLSDVQMDLSSFHNLQVLDLYNNSLEVMPISDTQLRRLVKFDVSYNYLSVETSLNRNFEDGTSVLSFYKKLEENLRNSFREVVARVSGSCPRSKPASIYSSDDSSDRSSIGSYCASDQYENDEDESKGYENGEMNGANEEEEEDWDAEDDDNFNPKVFTQQQPPTYPVQRSSPVFKTYKGDKKHFFLPSEQHAGHIRRRMTTFDTYPDQFSGATNSD